MIIFLIALGFVLYFVWLFTIALKSWRIKDKIRLCSISKPHTNFLIFCAPLFGFSILFPIFAEIEKIFDGNQTPWTFLILITAFLIVQKLIGNLPIGGYDYQREVAAYLREIRLTTVTSFFILIAVWAGIFLSNIHA